MRALNSRFLLIDLHSSWHSANQIPISTFSYLRNSNLISSISSSFQRTRRARKGIASSRSITPSIPSPEIRRPSDRFSLENGLPSVSLDTDSSSRLEVASASELDLLLDLLPLRMRKELSRHSEIGKLIEVVMDLGRQPLARFPSGDWVISDQLVKLEDLQHAISKVN